MKTAIDEFAHRTVKVPVDLSPALINPITIYSDNPFILQFS